MSLGAALLGVVLVAAFAAACEREEASDRCVRETDQAKSIGPIPYNPTASQKLVYLRGGGDRYAIPRNYFRVPSKGCDTEEHDLLLRVLLPTFEDWSKEKDKAFQGTPGQPWMGMNILLSEATKRNFLNGILRNYAPNADPIGNYPTWDGLLVAKGGDGEDVFFDHENGAVTFVMVCKTIEQVPYPTCSQISEYRGDFLKTTFQRTNLANWRAIRDGTIKLLDRFAAEASTQKAERGATTRELD